jgi:endo-1,4-beta-mannosidase
MRNFVIIIITFLLAPVGLKAQHGKWTAEKALEWYIRQEWPRGANFQPSTAINQLEMFQAATFDPATIDRELGYAQSIGLNTMRVFLHHIAWTSDKTGFKNRLNEYLALADKHGIKTILVFFDDCWNDTYQPGTQPLPKPGIHNSGWVRDPGTMILTHPDTLATLEKYVKDIMGMLKNDQRVLLWDLYNEPGNSGNVDKSLPLLQNVFSWARDIDPSQPITSGVWNYGENFKKLNDFQLSNSDVITYHDYDYIDAHAKIIEWLKGFKRPLICTEYMARRNGSLFQIIMPMLKANKIGAINWVS